MTETEITFPSTCDLTIEVLASKVAEYCRELANRPIYERQRQLDVAMRLWPNLRSAMIDAGIKLGLNGGCQPVQPEWSLEPVIPLAGFYGDKPTSRRAAETIARTHGDSGWVTMGEAWLLCAGIGPAYERGLAKYGYLPKK